MSPVTCVEDKSSVDKYVGKVVLDQSEDGRAKQSLPWPHGNRCQSQQSESAVGVSSRSVDPSHKPGLCLCRAVLLVLHYIVVGQHC